MDMPIRDLRSLLHRSISLADSLPSLSQGLRFWFRRLPQGSFGSFGSDVRLAVTTDLVLVGEDHKAIDVEDIGYNYHNGTADPRGEPDFPPDEDRFNDVGYTSFGLWSSADYQGAFSGGSAAAPLVSGVIALIYDAYDDVNGVQPDPFNPAGVSSLLTYRDIQHILVRSTWQNHFGDMGSGEVGQPDGWVTNRAGFKVNHKYGFGVIDAEKAVETAKIWPGIGAQRVFDTGRIEVLHAPTDPLGTDGMIIPSDGAQIGKIFNFDHRFSPWK